MNIAANDVHGAIPCTLMRGGTSRGLYFLRDALPADPTARDVFLLKAMGSPDPRQIDGIGGGDSLTSKVALVSRSSRPGIDVDYLFLQVAVESPRVSTAQTCGNILSGVAQFALENGLAPISSPYTDVRIYMENVGQPATARICTPEGRVVYDGEARIDGVPGTAAPVTLSFKDLAGAQCGALLPSGNATDTVNGVRVTLIDHGIPVVVARGVDFGLDGTESREALNADIALRARIAALHRAAGSLMGLGDVEHATVPKIVLVFPPRKGGCANTRSFIPHRCHASLGLFTGLSAAVACIMPGSAAAGVASPPSGVEKHIVLEHPAGVLEIALTVVDGSDDKPEIIRSTLMRTARKIMSGVIFG